MDIFVVIIIGALLVIVPLALFFGIIAVAVVIWSWRRIGPYFVNLGRWSADWRNFIPLSCGGLLGVILLIILAAVLPAVLRIPILIVLIVGAVIFIIFATIVWGVRFLHWFWPRYRVRFWNVLQWFWDLVWKGIPGQLERRMPGGPTPTRRVPPKQPLPTRSTGAASTQSTTATPGSPSPDVRRPPVRRSWLDLEWLWGFIWGKPEQGRVKQPQKKAATGEASQTQAAGPVPVEPSTGKPKAGLRPLTWRFGLAFAQIRALILGKPSQKPKGAGAEKTGIQQQSSRTVAPSAEALKQPSRAGQVKKGPKPAKRLLSSIGDRFADAIDTVREWPASFIALFRRKPKNASKSTSVVKSSPTSVIGQGAKSAGKGVIGAVESVRRTFWVGLFWIADRGRSSVDLVRRLLRLEKK